MLKEKVVNIYSSVSTFEIITPKFHDLKHLIDDISRI